MKNSKVIQIYKSKSITIKDICTKIWELEKEYDLFISKIRGVAFWKIIRIGVFLTIAKKAGIYEESHDKLPTDRYRLAFFKNIITSHLNGSSNRKKSAKILLFENPRHVLVDGKYIDPYTDWLKIRLKNEQIEYEIVDILYRGTHIHGPAKNRSYLDLQSVTYYLNKLINKNLIISKSKLILINDIQCRIKECFDIELDLQHIIKNAVRNHILSYRYYKKLLRRRKTSKVYLVCSYGREALIHACGDLGVETVEIQHGTMSPYHLGYSFPGIGKVPYFPSRMMMFGQYWYDTTPLPLELDKVEFIGYPYLRERLIEYREIKKIKNSILFISQGIIGKKLGEIAAEFVKNYPEFIVNYKLHPGEFVRWKEEYIELLGVSESGSINVIDGSGENLYYYLARAEYVVGVSSTAIFEAITLLCKVILVDLPSVEYMEGLLEKNEVLLAHNYCEIYNHINSTKSSIALKSNNYFW